MTCISNFADQWRDQRAPTIAITTSDPTILCRYFWAFGAIAPIRLRATSHVGAWHRSAGRLGYMRIHGIESRSGK